MSGQNKKRTYARNRTRLSRRGFDKNPEADGVFLLKLFLSIVGGSVWLKFANQLSLMGVIFGGFPIGAVISVIMIYFFEKRQMNRHIFYASIFIVTILSYFLPIGIIL